MLPFSLKSNKNYIIYLTTRYFIEMLKWLPKWYLGGKQKEKPLKR